MAVEVRNSVIRGEIFKLGQLIMDINEERGNFFLNNALGVNPFQKCARLCQHLTIHDI